MGPKSNKRKKSHKGNKRMKQVLARFMITLASVSNNGKVETPLLKQALKNRIEKMKGYFLAFQSPESIGIENDQGDLLSCDLSGNVVFNDDALEPDLRKDFLRSFGINPLDHIGNDGEIIDTGNLYTLFKLKAHIDGLKHNFSSSGLVVYEPGTSGDRVQFTDEGGNITISFYIGV